jgi:hypothetical protein
MGPAQKFYEQNIAGWRGFLRRFKHFAAPPISALIALLRAVAGLLSGLSPVYLSLW